MNTGTTAAIWREKVWDAHAWVERTRWRVQLSNSQDARKITATRREAIEWCQKRGLVYTLAPKPLGPDVLID